ncbi:antirestriction protein [Yersinia aleksiciae]|uniref:antirestriction protein n=1 Tax=Yersinia aleksiciae TaxID=263819 RepID=UPI0011A53EA1|nr:antirestriction protein [Yersinia aleksiciae]
MNHFRNKTFSQNECQFLAELLNDIEYKKNLVLRFDELYQERLKARISASRLSDIGIFGTVHIPPKGFYVFPVQEKVYLVWLDNFSISLDHMQFGMALTLEVLTIMKHETDDLSILDAYTALRHRILEKSDVWDGAYTYALLAGSLQYCG